MTKESRTLALTAAAAIVLAFLFIYSWIMQGLPRINRQAGGGSV